MRAVADIGATMIVDVHVHYHTADQLKLDLPGTAYRAELDDVVKAADEAGVDRLIQVIPVAANFDNAPSLEGAARYHDRIRVFGAVDPRGPALRERLASLKAQPYAVGLRYVLVIPPMNAWLRDGTLRDFWGEVERADLPISVYAPGCETEVSDIARRHPHLRLLVEHFDAQMFSDDPFKTWLDVMNFAGIPNIYLKASGLLEATHERGPFPVAHERLKQVYEVFGADRLMWASNYPAVLHACSYHDTVDFIDDAAFLTAVDRVKIFGGTANEVLRLNW
jgi:predicted TIM-barrel fold metal-dependent hydrolase